MGAGRVTEVATCKFNTNTQRIVALNYTFSVPYRRLIPEHEEEGA